MEYYLLVYYLVTGQPGGEMAVNWKVMGEFETRANCMYARKMHMDQTKLKPGERYECRPFRGVQE